MTRDDFWRIVDELIRSTNGLEEFQEALSEHLASLNPTGIEGFARQFVELQIEANTTGVLEAAYIIGCGHSNDGFMDFRRWIVFQGRSAFDQIVGNPDCLGDYDPTADPIEQWYCEYDPTWVYEEATGNELPLFDLPVYPDSPSDYDNVDVLAKRYPRLWQRCRG